MRAWWLIMIAGCGAGDDQRKPAGPPPPPAEYQRRWGGFSVRDGDNLVDAPAEDSTLLQRYAAWPSKGAEVDHVRLTLMTAKTEYAVGETVRVLHVLDVSVPGRGVYIMGPKRPPGENVDGKLATGAPEMPDYPWVGTYDGVVLPSPAIDYNYEVTTYRFDTPGTHVIQWRLGAFASNVISLHVR